MRFSSIKHFQRIKDSAGLAPKIGFITAQPIERKIGQIGQPQEAAGELDIASNGSGPKLGRRVNSISDVLKRCSLACGASPEQRMDNPMRIRQQLAALLAFTQMFGLNLK